MIKKENMKRNMMKIYKNKKIETISYQKYEGNKKMGTLLQLVNHVII